MHRGRPRRGGASSTLRSRIKSSRRWLAIPDAEHHGNSLYYDRIAGRALEFEARNGVIVRLARKHGIATPLADAAYALLSGASGSPLK